MATKLAKHVCIFHLAMASEPAPSRRTGWRIAGWLLAIALVMMLLTALLAGWLLTTERGTQTAFTMLQAASGGRVAASDIHGRLLGPLQIGKLTVRQPDSDLQIEQLQLEWQPAALQNKVLHVKLLRAASVKLVLHKQTDTPPARLQLPVQVLLDQVEIDRLQIEQDSQPLLALDALKGNLQFDGQRIKQAVLDIHGVELAQLQRRWPQTRFQLQAQLQANGNGTLSLNNLAAGRLDQSRLPLRKLSTSFTYSDAVLQLQDLQIDAGPGAQLQGSASLSDYALTAVVETRALDLRQLDARFRTTHLNGRATVKRNLSQSQQAQQNNNTQFSLALSEPWQHAPLQITTEISLDNTHLTVSSARLEHGNAHAEFSGAMELSGAGRFSARGKFHQLRPQDFAQFRNWPAMLLNGQFDTEGKRSAPAEATLQFAITESRLHGHPLAGNGKIILTDDNLAIPHLLLRAGANQLTVNGALRESAGLLHFSLHAPQLAQLGPQFGGDLQLSGSASGQLSAPKLSAAWQLHQLKLPAALRVAEASGKLSLQVATQQPFLFQKIDASLQAQGIRSGTKNIGTLSLQLQAGMAANDPFLLILNGQKIVLDKTRIEQAQLDVSGTLQQHTAALSITRNGASHSMTANSSLTRLDKHPAWRGKIEQMQLASLLALFEQNTVQSTNLVLDAEWDLKLTGDAQKPLQATLGLRRRSGDLTLRGMQTAAQLATPSAMAFSSLGLQNLDLAARIDTGRLSVKLAAEGKRLGLLAFSGSSAIAAGQLWQPDPHADINGQLSLQLPSVNWIGALLSSSVVADGTLRGDLRMAGSWTDPRFSGRLQGQQLRLLLVDSGIHLQRGVLDADFTGNTLTLRQLQFAGTSGLASVNGPIVVNDGKLTANLAMHAEQFGVYDRSDRQLVISGDAKLDLQENRAQLAGNVIVDRGFFDIGRAGTPQLSDDVIVTGRMQPAQRVLQLDVDLGVGLGQQLLLRGRGLNARAEGALRFTSKAGAPLQTFGLIQVSKGTYAAYGRELTIERGILRFDGAAGNPALDIRAMRRGTAVEPGVSIVGTAMAPRIALVSEPQVPDAEKLAWLVLGRGLSSAAGNELGDLQGAAASLLSQGAAAGIQSQLASAFGLDTISLSNSPISTGTVQQRIITLGKRVSSRLYVSYQQGLQNAAAAVVLRYTLSPRLTVEAESGTRSVFSLFYNVNFD